jgi:hypothetical protein
MADDYTDLADSFDVAKSALPFKDSFKGASPNWECGALIGFEPVATK